MITDQCTVHGVLCTVHYALFSEQCSAGIKVELQNTTPGLRTSLSGTAFGSSATTRWASQGGSGGEEGNGEEGGEGGAGARDGHPGLSGIACTEFHHIVENSMTM